MAVTINEKVRFYRKFFGYTQAEIAKKLGMKTTTYSQMERSGKISAEILVKLAKIFNMTTDELLNTPIEIIDTGGPPQPILTRNEKRLINNLHFLSEYERDKIYKLVQTLKNKKENP